MHGIHSAALVVACLLATPAFAEELAGPYHADVLRVIDGDTVEARIHVFLGLDQTTLVRVAGIDAPELKGHCPGEPQAAAAARDHLAKLTGIGPMQVSAIRRDKFGGRVVASIRLPSGEDAAAVMLASGHARAATSGRVSWCRP